MMRPLVRALISLAAGLAIISVSGLVAARDQQIVKTRIVAIVELPTEAKNTVALIKQGGPFPYAKDGTTFGNFEKRLPQRDRGFYKEYTVKTPGSRDRGARRVVAARDGEFYYTDDHYNSFRRIKE